MASMATDNQSRTDWPFGPFLTEAIKRSGMSKRAVARAARISEGRLRQLETGYQKAGGMHVPIATTVLTVLNLSEVLGFDEYEGLRLAGLEHAIKDETDEEHARRDSGLRKNPQLATYDTGQLMTEIAARYDDLARQVDAKQIHRVVHLVPPQTDAPLVVTETEEEDERRERERRRQITRPVPRAAWERPPDTPPGTEERPGTE